MLWKYLVWGIVKKILIALSKNYLYTYFQTFFKSTQLTVNPNDCPFLHEYHPKTVHTGRSSKHVVCATACARARVIPSSSPRLPAIPKKGGTSPQRAAVAQSALALKRGMKFRASAGASRFISPRNPPTRTLVVGRFLRGGDGDAAER